MNKILLFPFTRGVFIVLAFLQLSACQSKPEKAQFYADANTRPSGLLGQALERSRNGRLTQFITNETSEAIRIFHRDSVKNNLNSGWKGEHAGKWLYTAARSARFTHNEALRQSVIRVANFLISQQEPDGYLGVYAPANRMTTFTDSSRQTWDAWINAYILQGLTESYRLTQDTSYLNAAQKLGNLFVITFMDQPHLLSNTGCFEGMAANGVLGNFVDLYTLTGDKRYLSFAEHCVEELEQRPGVNILTRSLKEYDLAEIGSGKMYEMLRCYEGIARLYAATGKTDYLKACLHAWTDIKNHHLSVFGAPWGGIGIHHECFNKNYMFRPYGYSETCAMMDWFRLNKQLLQITGEARFAEEMEKTAYNGLLGAQFSDGLGWTYHSHANGKITRTSPWACCSSSGTLTLEELPDALFSLDKQTIWVNIYSAGTTVLPVQGGDLKLTLETGYPMDSQLKLSIQTQNKQKISLRLRIPIWATNAEVKLNGTAQPCTPGDWCTLSRNWKNGDVIELNFPINVRYEQKSYEYNELGWYMDGKTDYSAFFAGPLALSAEWPDELSNPNSPIVETNELKNISGKVFQDSITMPTNKGILNLKPYYKCGNNQHEAFRACWFQLSK